MAENAAAAVECKFDTYAAYREQFLDALRNTRRSLLIFDRDLSQTALESRDGIEALDTLARDVVGEEPIRILVSTATYIEQSCPRLLKLVERYGPRMRIKVVAEGTAHPDGCFLIGDGRVLVTRFHVDRARGKRVDGASPDIARNAAQFETMWISAKIDPSGAALGI